MTIDNWGIGFADDFKYNYTEVRLFKGFVKISAEGAQQLSIIHCQLSICDKIAKSGFIDKQRAAFLPLFAFNSLSTYNNQFYTLHLYMKA